MAFWAILVLILVVLLTIGLHAESKDKGTSASLTKNVDIIGKDEFKLNLPRELKQELDEEGIEAWAGIKTDDALARYRHPALIEGERLKYSDPQKALEILLPLCDIEKGKYVKHVCLQCYRNLKDYESEKKMIHRILDQIENVQPYDCDELEYHNMKASEQTYYKRLNYVNQRIESIKKKEQAALNKKQK